MNTYTERKRTRGLGLVELMVAIAIGAVLLGGAIQLFVSNKATYEVTTDISRLQENARFALDLMARDLRMAGHFGCHSDGSNVFNNLTNDDPTDDSNLANDVLLWSTRNPIEGLDDAVGVWSPSGAAAPTGALAWVPGTDGLTIRYLRGPGMTDADADGTVDYEVEAFGDTIITVDAATDISQNQLVGISSCGRSDIFRVVNDPGGGSSIQHDSQVTTVYDTSAEPYVTQLEAVRYYIGQGTEGPSLIRETLVAGDPPTTVSRELVEGVESMQIIYGLDQPDASGNQDGVVDTYVAAGNPGAAFITDPTDPLDPLHALNQRREWGNVVSVRIGFLFRTINESGTEPSNLTQYIVNGTTVCDARDGGPCDVWLDIDGDGTTAATDADDVDRRRRRVFTTSILARNMQCRRPRDCRH